MSKSVLVAAVSSLAVVCAGLVIWLAVVYSDKNKKDNAAANDTINRLQNAMNDNLRAPPLVQGGVVRVYVSGGMFDIADTLYSVGYKGMLPGLSFQSINLVDQICNLSDAQMTELDQLCTLWNVPAYGICGVIENMGWEAYCPVRDGLTMATLIAAVNGATSLDQLTNSDPSSLFYPANIQAALKAAGTPYSDAAAIEYCQGKMVGAIGLSIGANDLYNMYSTCNACIMNYNGIQADAGALAEVGQLGARGVPCVIIKGQVTGDFGGITNPMPVMATTAGSMLWPHLTNDSLSVFGTVGGAMDWLQAKVNRFIYEKTDDFMSIGDYNSSVPLPPLQIFWADLGSASYFLKHKYKSIQTVPKTGQTDFQKDYTDFWYQNVVSGGGAKGFITVSAKMADNLALLLAKPEYKNVHKYWD